MTLGGRSAYEAEEVADRIRDKYGPGAIGPAAALGRVS